MKVSTAITVLASYATLFVGVNASSNEKQTHNASIRATSSKRDRSTRRLQTEGCILLLKKVLYEDHSEKEEVECFDATTNHIISLSAYEAQLIDRIKSGEIQSGGATLKQEGAFYDDENRRLMLIEDERNIDSLTIESIPMDHEAQRRKLVEGTKSVLVIRADANDLSTTSNESTLSDNWFGNGRDTVNFKSQMEACSYNKFQVEKSTVNSSFGTDGVYSVNLDLNVAGVSDGTVRNAMLDAAEAALGVSNLRNQADYVALCIPGGTSGSWIAYAYVNSWLSVYNNNCGENSSYDDQTGMMGYSYGSDDGPRMCFNAAKNAQLGWYEDKTETVSGTGWTGSLHGISDYGSSSSSTVLLKIEGRSYDWYVSFNRRSGINSGTKEGANQVLIHRREKGTGYSTSKLMAKRGSGGEYSNNDISSYPIKVDSIGTFATVTIGAPPAGPTPAPTNAPTTGPTPPPVPAPSREPTSSAPTRPPVLDDNQCSSISNRGVCRRQVGCSWNRFQKKCIEAPTTDVCRSFNNKKARCKKSGCRYNVNKGRCRGFYD
ncbi:hypothetical protein CTEN210_12686 [Chaetoceros tenuissimus]|uniref:Uncharacterized protein n=1 Tax=Chaetoceros tenuissimus TaxID=426638 RepID=A0AAD3HAB5_9STRA|nr:hypothetical protein CTEN210_12686 [Chaetoceros tenuissimus]